jgi:hypothetical protein
MPSKNPNPANNKPRDDVHDFPMRCGTDLLDAVNAAAEAEGLDRSAYADKLINESLRRGLPDTMSTKLVVDAMRRDGRCLLRLGKKTVKKLFKTSEQLGLPASLIVQIIFIGALDTARAAA